MPLSTFSSSPKHRQKKTTYKKFTYPYPEVRHPRYSKSKIVIYTLVKDISSDLKKSNPDDTECVTADV